ncbi:hypothetical protein PDIDSM_764 [Penicillium digitatum]|nr:hypothetical protein PDIDSM_764 [Penicillium digitatum]
MPITEGMLKATETEESSDSNKRALPHYALCVNCKKEFDVTANSKRSGRYRLEQ